MTTSLEFMLTARLVFPRFSERLACEAEAVGLVTLHEFSEFLPLGPGDQVLVDHEGVVTGVHQLAPAYIVVAHFMAGTSHQQLLDVAGAWNLATNVRPETLSVQVMSENRDWIEEVVGSEPLVDVIEWQRSPGDDVDIHADDDNQMD